jgi:hypothetical protein
VTDRIQLRADLARALEDGPCSGSRLAHGLGTRKADVLALLRASPTFERIGKGRYTTWKLAGTEQEPLQGNDSVVVMSDLVARIAAVEARLDRLDPQNARTHT